MAETILEVSAARASRYPPYLCSGWSLTRPA